MDLTEIEGAPSKRRLVWRLFSVRHEGSCGGRARAKRPLDANGLLTAGVIVLGCALRLALWAQARSLWIDEARLSLNVASRSYLPLLQPLDLNQTAPPLYLWIQRSAVVLFGVNELALRVAALIAGMATLILMFLLARRVFNSRVALLAATIAAVSPTLIYFSSEAKQYGIEACVACSITYLAARALQEPVSNRRWAAVIGGGAIAIWLASPVVFVLAGTGLALVVTKGIQLQRRIAIGAIMIGLWGASLAVAYQLVYGAAARDPYLQHYWSQAFLGLDRPRALLDAAMAFRGVLWGPISVLWGPMAMDSLGGPADLASVLFAPALSIVMVLVLFVGVRRLVRVRAIGPMTLLASPIVLVFVASALRVYPISARTTMFYMPLLLVFAAAGIEELAGHLRSNSLNRAALLAPNLLLLVVTLRELNDRNPREHIRPLIAELQSLRKDGEPVYVFAGAIPAWAVYTTDWNSPDRARLRFIERIARAGGGAFENAPSRGRPVVHEGDDLTYATPRGEELYGVPHGLEARVFGLTNAMPDPGWSENEARRIGDAAHPGAWLVFSHFYGPEGQLLEILEGKGARLTYKDFRNGAVLLRYEFPG